MVSGHAQVLPAPRGNVLFYDADPFVTDSAVCLGGVRLGDWTTPGAGVAGGWIVGAASQLFDGGSFGAASELRVDAVPAATRFLLVNQPRPDVSVFNFSVPARGIDRDENGLPDVWERRYFGAVGLVAQADPDGDGASNADEADAGTDPWAKDSVPGAEEELPRLEAEVLGTWVRLRWQERWAKLRIQSAGRLGLANGEGWSTLRCEQAPPGSPEAGASEVWIPVGGEARFFRLVRPAKEAVAVPTPPEPTPCLPEGVLAFWKGDAGGQDLLGHHHGSWTGPARYGAGRAGQAFHFEGSGRSLIRIPDSPGLHRSEFTVTAWIQPELDPDRPLAGFAPGGLVFGKVMAAEAGQLSVALRATPAPGLLGYIQGRSGTGALLNASRTHWWSPNTNTWYHLGLRVRPDSVTLFLNGVPLPSSTLTPVDFLTAWDAGDSCIGGAPFSGPGSESAYAFRGLVDEVAFFGRALSVGEMESLASMDPVGGRLPPGWVVFGLADETIWAMPPTGVGARFLTVGVQPRLSPDSGRLLFRRRDGSPGGQVLVKDLETGREHVVHPAGTWVTGYSWFSDSLRLAMDDFNLGPSRQGFRAVLATAGLPGVEMLSRHPWDVRPAVSPDGLQVAYETLAAAGPALAGLQLGRLDPDLRIVDVRSLPGATASDTQPTWSPDGRWISVSDKRDLAIVELRTGTRRVLTRLALPEDGFSGPAPFARDGSAVIAAGVVEGVRGIYSIPITEAGQPRLLRAIPRFESGATDTLDEVGGIVPPRD